MTNTKYSLNKTHNTSLGIITGIINKVVTMLIPFIVRTLFIRILGIEFLGLNSVIVSILQVLNLAELGFSSAVVYSMYKPIANRDDDTICALLNFYKRIYRIVGVSVFVMGISLLPFIAYFIKSTPPDDVNIYIVYIVYLFNSSISYLLYGYKTSLLNAHQRVDIINNISTVTISLNSVLQILVLLLYPNYYIYILLGPIFTIMNNLLVSHIVNKKFPNYICHGKISVDLRKDIQKKVAGLMIQKVCAFSRNSVNNIFLSAFISLSIVGIYNNYYLIFSTIIGLLSVVNTSMVGGIGNAVQTQSVDENLKIMYTFNCLFMWICTIAAVCLLCLYQPFMELWVGKQLMLDFSTVILLVVYFFVLKMGDIRSIWVDSVGLFWEIRYRAIIESLLNIVLNLFLVKQWGVNGAIVGTLISLFLINFIYSSSITFQYYFGLKRLSRYYIIQLYFFLVMGISCFCVYKLCLYVETILNISTLLGIIAVRFGLSITVTNLILYLFLKKTADYRMAKDWMKMKLKR